MIFQNSDTSGNITPEFTWIILVFLLFILILVIHIIYRWYRIYSKKQQENKPLTPDVMIKKIPSPKFRLMVGGTYLILERNPSEIGTGFKTFLDHQRTGAAGLIITRALPGKIRNNYNIRDIPIIWLTRSSKKNSITPTNLGDIIDEIKEFTIKNKNSLVMFDGLEYLMIHNDFERVLKFLHSLRDEIAVNHARLIISLNPKTLSKNQIALLTKEVKILNS